MDARQPLSRRTDLGPARQSLGRGPDLVQTIHADRSNHMPAEFSTVAILPHLGVQTEQFADDLVKALALPPHGEFRTDLLDRRNDFWSNSVHHHVSVALEQRHYGGDAVDDGPLGRSLDEIDDRDFLVVAQRFENPGNRVAEHAQQRTWVQFRRAYDGVDLRVHVFPQPRDRGELNAVGLLVQTHPEPEVGRVDLQLTLHGDDVGGDQQQPAAGLTFGSGVERVELSQHLGRKVAEQCTYLHTRDPRAELSHGGVGSAQPVGSLGGEGPQHLPEAVEVRLDPTLAVDHQHRRGVARRFQTGYLRHVGLGTIRAVP